MHIAIKSNQPDIAKAILTHKEVDVNSGMLERYYIVVISIIVLFKAYSGYSPLVEDILNHPRVDVNATNKVLRMASSLRGLKQTTK